MKTKKFLFGSAAALLIAVGAYLNTQMARSEQQVSDLTLANIEAMAGLGIPDLPPIKGVAACLGWWGPCSTPSGGESKAPLVEASF